MRLFFADLHIHTALSPCAGEEMTPPAIVAQARRRGLAMIAVCDHNASGNAAVCEECAARSGEPGLAVVAGMEITTAEEVHVLGLFPSSASAGAAAAAVRATLPAADEAYYARFGEQSLLDDEGRVVGREPRMLADASTFELNEAVQLIHRHGGLAIAAHVNRRSFSVLSQLGVFPADAGFDAIEVFAPCGPADSDGSQPTRGPGVAALAAYSRYRLPLLSSSDSHYLGDIGSARSVLRLEEPTFDELARALRGEAGRGVRAG